MAHLRVLRCAGLHVAFSNNGKLEATLLIYIHWIELLCKGHSE